MDFWVAIEFFVPCYEEMLFMEETRLEERRGGNTIVDICTFIYMRGTDIRELIPGISRRGIGS